MKKKKQKKIVINSIEELRNVAVQLHQNNNLTEAEELYKELLNVLPTDTTAWTNLGTIALQRGNYKDAMTMIDKSLSIDPNQPFALNNRGNILRDLGLLNEALECYNKGLAINDTLYDLNYNCAIIKHSLGDISEAVTIYTKLIDSNTNDIRPLINRGNIYHELGKHQEAINDYNTAIQIDPNFSLSYSNRGIVYQDIYELDNAIESYNIALSLEPSASVYSNRGNIFQSQHKIAEALTDYEKAIELDPNFPIAYGNKANALMIERRIDEALEQYNKALSIDPDFADALWNKSVALLTKGQYLEGFKLFENRWRSSLKHHYRKMNTPLWLGNESLYGKTIFIYPEQGFGDFIQFCRYLPLLDALNTNVIVEVPAILNDLIKTVNCNATFINTETITEYPKHDYHCPIMSLPGAFYTTLDTIPNKNPYLFANKEKSEYWANKIGTKTKPRIGLVWSGGFRPEQPETWAINERRNIKLANLECFNQINAEFYSLQKGPASNELVEFQAFDIIDHTNEIASFDDTAALIDNLDLVISVDTSTAHVAAALGKPTWIFNRYDSCWRWLENRTESPWYPTVTLFTQTSMGDWNSVIEKILAQLKSL